VTQPGVEPAPHGLLGINTPFCVGTPIVTFRNRHWLQFRTPLWYMFVTTGLYIYGFLSIYRSDSLGCYTVLLSTLIWDLGRRTPIEGSCCNQCTDALTVGNCTHSCQFNTSLSMINKRPRNPPNLRTDHRHLCKACTRSYFGL
jgi:hypothetical protein